jgi:hypothetical protein
MRIIRNWVPRETESNLPEGQPFLRIELWNQGIAGDATAEYQNPPTPRDK